MDYLEHIKPWVGIPVVYIIVFGILSNLRSSFWKYLDKHSQSFSVSWPQQLLIAFKSPIRVLIWLLAFLAAIQLAPQELKHNSTISFGVKIFCIIITGWLLNRAFGVVIKNKELLPSLTLSSRALFLTILRVVSLSIIGLIILDNLGVSITPVLASLGVGSIAVGLALKDTLDNFFTGFYLLIDQPIRVGDYIKVEDNVEGKVIQIGWRSTKIELTSQNTVIFPNSKLAASRLTNFEIPVSESIIIVSLSVPFQVDMEIVQKLIISIGEEVMNTVEGGVPGHIPLFRITEFREANVYFNVILKAKKYPDHSLIRHEFMKKIHAQYRLEGIPTPYTLVQMIDDKTR